ncbi:hypothetical protein BJY04DRAFT_36205 [Aspergillus karnatakaensis]|uniref:uncharacterized protein n=1 Tax=Aspergillus karnatakaensis TaxID=1810916 RepID=UPI003CCD4262
MASHGVSRHGRYERLLRKHQFNTRENGHEPTSDEIVGREKKMRSKNLHDEWVAIHEKRQQDPSAIAANPQTTTANADPVPTTAGTDAQTAVTAVTTITTTVGWPPDPTTESALGKATVTNDPEAAIAPSVSESTKSAATETLPTEAAEFTVTGSLSEVADITATVAPEDETSTSTEESPESAPTSTTAPATHLTSVPIIGQNSESIDESPISLTSSLNLPTAIAVPGSTSTIQTSSAQSIIAGMIASEESSTPTDTSTDSTSTTSTSTGTSTGTSIVATPAAEATDTDIDTATNPIPTSSSISTTTSSTTTPLSPSQSGGYGGSGYGWGDNDSSGDVSGDSETTAASPDSTALSNSDSGSMTPQTTGKIVGGVVGGVAGATLIFLLIFLLLRRRRKTGFFFGSPARSIAGDGGGGLIPEPSTRQMVSRDSNKDSMFGAAYFAPAFMKRWRQSDQSTDESFMGASPTERGFQKVSGRKLPSGIQPGFGYSSGGLEAGSPTESDDLSPTLPPVLPRNPFTQPPPSNPFSHPLDATVIEDDRPVMRPSPARIPTSGSATATNWAEASASARSMQMSFPLPPSNTVAIPKRPDALGRSHPSYDGSRGSRFSENL